MTTARTLRENDGASLQSPPTTKSREGKERLATPPPGSGRCTTHLRGLIRCSHMTGLNWHDDRVIFWIASGVMHRQGVPLPKHDDIFL